MGQALIAGSANLLRASKRPRSDDDDDEHVAKAARVGWECPRCFLINVGASQVCASCGIRIGLMPITRITPHTAPPLERMCVVCSSSAANYAPYECGHLCMCMDCIAKLLETTKTCPMCRAVFKKYVRIYL
jgi:hypothetical protein